MKKKKIIIASAINLAVVALIAATIVAGSIMEPILTMYLGSIGASSTGGSTYSAYKTEEELTAARKKTSYDILAESATLLKNENAALPLSKTAKVSIFGQHAHEILASGSGSGSVGDPNRSLKEVLEQDGKGMSVNQTLWDFYLNNGISSIGAGPALAGGNSVTDWSINECPQSKYTDDVKSTYADYADAAIVVLSRIGGEGGDLAMDMSPYGGSAGEHYLELCAEEREMFQAIKNAGFKHVVVLLNTNNPLELGFLDEYGIDACLYIGGVGMDGLEAVYDLLTGVTSPSGRLSDTYVYDNFSSPASQNFGDFAYSNVSGYNYVVYAEGIYVGYRYYETRYADVTMGADNAGSYDYDSTVIYPFGYGLSYADFTWSDFALDYDESEDRFSVSVKVTNDSETVSAKDVVEVYFSAPYTHGSSSVEKAAVELAGFAKTSLLGPKESETVTIYVDKSALASYDAESAKTYVLDAGDYYFTAAPNAHKATQNVLHAQGYSVDGSELFDKYEQTASDSVTYASDPKTSAPITNIFDDAKYDGMKVLSRDDWEEVDTSIAVKSLALSDENLAQAQKSGAEASLNPNYDQAVASPTMGNDSGAQLKDYIETDYDDESWDEIVEAIKKGDLQKLFSTAGYNTLGIEYIGKPSTKDSDGPAGLQSFVGGATQTIEAYGYPTETLLSCSWNEDVAKEMGQAVGEDGIWGGVSGWYAPGMNTHRSPFGGRNFEYYSEDGLLAGKIGAAVVEGAQEKGVYCYIKHFALNEQDTNRGTTLHTWADEQAMREIYLEPFRISVEEGGAMALMTSLNCIGVTAAVGNYNLVTKLLKNEWGFQGMVITDYLAFDQNIMMQTLYAGGDAMLSTYGLFSDKSDATMAQLQRAAKNILYTVSRSNAMYTLLDGGSVSLGFPVYKLIIIIVDVTLGLGLIIADILIFMPKRKKKEEGEKAA